MAQEGIRQQLCHHGLSILGIIQDGKDGEGAFKRLAMDACNLVLAVKSIAVESAPQGISSETNPNLQDLILTLSAIIEFGRKHISRKGLGRMASHSTDVLKIKQYQAQINHSRAKLKPEGNFTSHEDIATLREELRRGLGCQIPTATVSPSHPHTGPTSREPLPPPSSADSPPLAAPVRPSPIPATGNVSTRDISSYFGAHSTVSIGGNFNATTIHGNQINNTTYDTLNITGSYNSAPATLPPPYSS
ncbi:hypothetical protein C8J57DRAFT_1378209 [Mycena rebaudengoi]|nr:hypothetical protein C8J57DRAFT_1378209 [Mycena rebaudengoi]